MGDRMSRYDELTMHLAGRSEPVVELTFSDLDRLVVGGLPHSARVHAAWWSNSRVSRPHSRYWLDAGRQAQPDFNGGRVRFPRGSERRIGPRLSTPRFIPSKVVPSEISPRYSVSPGETLEAELKIEWLSAGEIQMATDRIIFPDLPVSPGIYRFDIFSAEQQFTSIYVGESDNLNRRMGQYRNPGPSQATNQRMNSLLLANLRAGGEVALKIVLTAVLDKRALDFSNTASRRLVENLALVLWQRDGMKLENL